jgi:hypothetical protein
LFVTKSLFSVYHAQLYAPVLPHAALWASKCHMMHVKEYQLSWMIRLLYRVADAGRVVPHWLHTLLLEPDSQLALLCAAAGSSTHSGSSMGGGGSSSSSADFPAMGPCGFDAKALYELQQQLLQPDSALSLILSADLEPWLPADPPPGMWRPEQGQPGQSSSTSEF